MTTPANKRMRRAFVYLVCVGFALNAAVLILFAQTINSSHNDVHTTRQYFCELAVSVHAAAETLPQVPGRVNAEAAYALLENHLNCAQLLASGQW